MQHYDIDFSRILPHDQDKQKSFESLAYTLFRRRKMVENINVLRISDAGGDGGIEALADDGEAIQAKYLFSAAKSKGLWGQLDNSVRQAIRTYGSKLKKYTIYAPCQLGAPKFTKKGVKNATSWETYVAKWQKLYTDTLAAQGIEATLAFEFISDDDMREILMRDEMQDIRNYWFNRNDISLTSLREIYDESKANLGSRYNEALHIDTDILTHLSNFCNPARVMQGIKQAVQHFENHICRIGSRYSDYNIALPSFSAEAFATALSHSEKAALDIVFQAKNTVWASLESLSEPRTENDVTMALRCECLHRELTKAAETLESFHQAIYQWRHYHGNLLLFYGSPGSGKSHHLGELTKQLLRRNQPALLLLGSDFSDCSSIKKKLVELSRFEGSFEELLSAWNGCAEHYGQPFIVIIDAVNESSPPRIWRDFLKQLPVVSARHPNIKWIFSCKEEYLSICTPQENNGMAQPSAWRKIRLHWSKEAWKSLTRQYFRAYNVGCKKCDVYEELLSDPLELIILCEVFENSELSDCYPGLLNIFERWREQRVAKITDNIDIASFTINKAIDTIALSMWQRRNRSLPIEEAAALITPLHPTANHSESLLQNLIGAGILQCSCIQNNEHVHFPYELLSCYFELRAWLKSPEGIECYSTESQQDICSDPTMACLMHLFCINQTQRELPNIWESHRENLMPAFIRSLKWRSSSQFQPETQQLIRNKLPKLVQEPATLYEIVKWQLLKDHPLNARAIDAWLATLSLPELDFSWTVPLTLLYHQSPLAFDHLLNHRAGELNALSAEKAYLLALALGWLCGSNTHALRETATQTLSDVLYHCPQTAESAVAHFAVSQDLRLRERVYAAACKAALRCCDATVVRAVAQAMVRGVVNNPVVGFTCKRYSEIIVQRALLVQALSKAEADELLNSMRRLTPVYQGLSATDVSALEHLPHWRDIAFSTQTEKDGLYGDFGRYVMTSLLFGISATPIEEGQPDNDEPYDCDLARRIVLQLIQEMGWSEALYNRFDKVALNYARGAGRSEKPVIRIGKKYQMIALDRLIASLDDYYPIRERAWLDRLLPFNLNDFRFIEQPPTPSLPTAFQQSDYLTVEEFLRDKPWELLEHVRTMNMQDYLYTAFTDSGVPCVLLGGHRILSISLRSVFDVGATLFSGVKCWIVESKHATSFAEYCSKKSFYGSGICLEKAADKILGLYPGAAEQSEFEENMWLRNTPFPVYNAAVSLGFSDAGVEMPAPSKIIMDFMHLAWDEKAHAFVSDSAVARPFSTEGNDSRQALYISAAPFAERSYAAGYTPFLACIIEGHIFDYKHGKHGKNSPVCRELFFRIEQDGHIQLLSEKCPRPR